MERLLKVEKRDVFTVLGIFAGFFGGLFLLIIAINEGTAEWFIGSAQTPAELLKGYYLWYLLISVLAISSIVLFVGVCIGIIIISSFRMADQAAQEKKMTKAKRNFTVVIYIILGLISLGISTILMAFCMWHFSGRPVAVGGGGGFGGGAGKNTSAREMNSIYILLMAMLLAIFAVCSVAMMSETKLLARTGWFKEDMQALENGELMSATVSFSSSYEDSGLGYFVGNYPKKVVCYSGISAELDNWTKFYVMKNAGFKPDEEYKDGEQKTNSGKRADKVMYKITYTPNYRLVVEIETILPGSE